MAIVATLLDKAKHGKSLTSDSALATAIGTNRQVVSQWRNGDSYPSEDNIAALALMAGDDPTQWLVAIKAVRSEGSAGKYWAALAKRLAATTMTLALGVLFALPARAQDAVAAFQAPAEVYIMRNVISARRTRSHRMHSCLRRKRHQSPTGADWDTQ